MKTSKEDILMIALQLFAERGYEAVSTAMIASALGITKGALYRHFENKQQIFDSIIAKMYALDEERAHEDHVPAKSYEEAPESYRNQSFPNFCEFVNHQFLFWTEDAFATAFRKMITIEQYKSVEMQQLYQTVIGMGPVQYSADLLQEMMDEGQLNEAAREKGAFYLAMDLFAPLKLAIELADGGENVEKIQRTLKEKTKEFEKTWIQLGQG